MERSRKSVDPNLDIESDEEDSDHEQCIPRTPFIAAWLVPLIRPTITNAPMTFNENLKDVLKLYANDFASPRAFCKMQGLWPELLCLATDERMQSMSLRYGPS